MAGDWIKMRSCLHSHPKVVRIASALKEDKLRVVGALHAVWCLFDMHSTDGKLDGYSPKTLDEQIGWPGFADQMIAVKWLEASEGGLVTPSFERHNGQSAKRRAQEADRKRNDRAEQSASASDADELRTREEKIREEIKPTTSSSGDDVGLCPVGTLVDLYHECMPLNPRVKVLSEARKRSIRQRWKEAATLTCKPFGYSTRSEGLIAWRAFFEICAASDFLTGKARPEPGKPPFVADVDFLFKASSFAKTIENKYHREAA